LTGETGIMNPNPNFNWSAITGAATLLMAIGTFIMAFFTYQAVKQTRNRDAKLERFRVIDELIHPLREILINMAEQVFNLHKIHLPNWNGWKTGKPYLVLAIPENLRRAADEILEKSISYNDIQHRHVKLFYSIIKEEIEKARNSSKTGSIYSSQVQNIHFSLYFDGKEANININNLLVLGRNPKQYIEQLKDEHKVLNDKEIKITDDKASDLAGDGIRIEEFKKIYNSTKKRIELESEEIKELIKTARWLKEKTTNLATELDCLVRKWSK
jgi:hypothetical protein